MQKIKLHKKNGKTYVEVQSLLAALRDRGYQNLAKELENGLLRLEEEGR